jgi:23S rRNA (cytosine1962-C5)-methyltransferase
MERITLTTEASKEYQLLDSGREEKLEKYGRLLLSRPDPQALWEKHLSPSRWQAADGRFIRKGREGEWKTNATFPKEWQITFGGFVFAIRATSFKHTGLFPEQLPNWEWLKERLQAAKYTESPKVLNLFGYTGGATLAAAAAGAQVTHVDASKVAVTWAKENARLSGLSEKPTRWIIEDTLTFVKREIRRGNTYDGIIMDPPD